MKKLGLLLFALFVGLLFNMSVSAASYMFSCEYHNSDYVEYGTMKLTFRTNGDDIKMVGCTTKHDYTDTEKDCSKMGFVGDNMYTTESIDWIFDANGNYSKNSNSCPSSIDISGMDRIVWIKESRGMLRYVEGSKSDLVSTGEKTSCLNFNNKTNCETFSETACVWVDAEDSPTGKGFCNVDNLLYVGCGGASDIPIQVPALISFAVNLLKIATPIILIFISIISLLKALAAQKDDEIKKAQSSLVKKIIAAALVFFVVSIVQFVVSKVGTEKDVVGFSNCLKCFLNNDCKLSAYYKTTISGEDYCTVLKTDETYTCEEMYKRQKVNLDNYSWYIYNDKWDCELYFDTLEDVKQINLIYNVEENSFISSRPVNLNRDNNTASISFGELLTPKDPKLEIIFNDGDVEYIEFDFAEG